MIRLPVPFVLLVLAAAWCLPAAAETRLPVPVPVPGPGATIAALEDEAAEEAADEALDLFNKAIKTYRMAEVERALVVWDETYDDLPPKLAKKVDKAVAKLFATKPRIPKEQGEDTREELIDSYHLAIGLVFERPQGAKLLEGALKQRHVKDWPDMKAMIIEGLGYRRDPKSFALLVDHLEDDAAVVAGAAATGLGALSEEGLDTRRSAVREILGAWTEAVEMARREVTRKKDTTVAQDRLEQIEGPFELALRELTRKRFDGVEAWEAWFQAEGGGTDW